jgi:HK97 family phage major capsid protein
MDAYTRATLMGATEDLRAANLKLALLDEELQDTTDTRLAKLFSRGSIAGCLRRLAYQKALIGAECEVNDELVRLGARLTSGNGAMVPYCWLLPANRALMATTQAGGGFLTQTLNLSPAPFLWANTVSLPLGATLHTPPMGAYVDVPKILSKPTVTTMTTETTQVSESDLSFGQLGMSPHTIGADVQLSDRLVKQTAGMAGDVVAAHTGRALGGEADKQGLFGTGLNGQTLGIANTNGINTFSASSATKGKLIDAATALADALNPTLGLATTLAGAGVLAKRQEASGTSGFIWNGRLTDGIAAGMNARSSSQLTANNVVVGVWSYQNVVVWGPGVEIAVDPYTAFQQLLISYRALMTFDAGPTWPSAFNLATDLS